ncbi:MAG: aminoacetone oxidase family FAD-binding enzyme [Ruminococcaceae bacterium]|nr:aminoacetone oxidase family FAD-binding enzyme [Oscillospiraceae bacterium]
MTVLIIGGGAAGMVAALTAAESGHQVILTERQARVGRKLMATGNGRCNLTNLHTDPSHYHGQDPDFCRPALERFPVADTLKFFARLGLLTVSEPSGRVYPISNMAGSVLDVLRYALEQPAIELRTASPVVSLKKKGDLFTARTEDGQTISCDRVILAAGGAAGSKVGGVMDGYQLAKSMGHHRTALYPSLVQLRTDPTYPRALKGVKADACLRILQEGETVAQRQGEILFTEYGISGPAVFDVSRTAATGSEGMSAQLDFLPDYSWDDTLLWLRQRQQAMIGREAGLLLTGSVHTRLGQMLCKAAGFTNQPVSALTEKDLQAIARQLRSFTLPILGVCGFDQAQVTAGGLVTDEFDPRTMQSRLVPGLYVCGELLDVDGDCGGFNLQWAWSSGRLAGLLTT